MKKQANNMKEFNVAIYNDDGSHCIIKATINLNEVIMFQEYSEDKRQTHLLLTSGHDSIVDEPYETFKENFIKKASDE